MAITNARMQMRRGLEADFDPDKMRPGEWAVSLDKKYVRMCFSVGVCVRMATYDAFEEDMAQIKEILSTCETIEEAVSKINTEVSANAQAVEEYTEQAKKYRDEAKQFRDEAETFKPDGYAELKETVASNTVKIDTIIEKAELNIKNSASGENIHLTDSANGKNVAFGLYGKAEQKQYSGKNLLKTTKSTHTTNEITFTINNDGSVRISGTASAETASILGEYIPTIDVPFIFTAGIANGTNYTIFIQGLNGNNAWLNAGEEQRIPTTTDKVSYGVYVKSGATVDFTIYPMIRLASITDSTYEPYVGGIASPNPDYPQEITVSGSDGSVEVVSCGKNLFNPDKLVSSHASYEDGVLTVHQIAGSTDVLFNVAFKENTQYTLSAYSKPTDLANYNGVRVRYTDGTTDIALFNISSLDYEYRTFTTKEGKTVQSICNSAQNGYLYLKELQIEEGAVATEYEPYTETTSTIPTQNGIAGIKVDSGGNYTDENGQQWICDEVVKYADGSGKRIQRIGKYVFNGTESWYKNGESETEYRYYLNKARIGIDTVNNNGMCTHFQIANTTSQTTILIYSPSVPTSLYIGAQDILTTENTVESFKEWLSNNNVSILYILATPIITDLTAEEIAEIEKLHTFYPITNISNDADCGMAVTYMADAKNYIDNRLALIESAMLNNI